MHDDRRLIELRVRRILEDRLRPAVYGARVPLAVAAWEAPGEPVPAEQGLAAQYGPFETGRVWGRPWSTTWFRFDGVVPAEWAGRSVEAVIDLGYDPNQPGFSCEGLAYAEDGRIVKGLSPRNHYLPVPTGDAIASSGLPVRFYVEAAANPDLGSSQLPTPLGDARAAGGGSPLYTLRSADLAVRHPAVAGLVADVDLLIGLAAELSGDEPRRHRILQALERMLDRLDLQDVPATAADAAEELADVLAQPAAASAHNLSAVGNAHIDTAWLWPLRETRRKVARTVANALALAQDDPAFLFGFSQAQQLDWLKQDKPELYARLREAVAQGRVVLVGGLWVEPDGNLPGGEAMARQMVYGKRFFAEEFGVETREVWMPDSFGYNAALPQLAKLAGNSWMLTQKLSWNQSNRFPHHTFWWEGLDGSRIFTHFPPVDTYNATMSPRELLHASRTYAEHGRGTRSLVPFGYGDGGGGPTREMMAAAHRSADLEGLPRVRIEAPEAFFEQARAEYPDAPVWSGELYLELHRGTFTSQARSKAANRRSEHLMREAELWASAAWLQAGAEYPYEELERIWKDVLLLQFHDILPGSSINWVYQDSDEIYARIAADAETVIAASLAALAGEGTRRIAFNAAPHANAGIPALGASPADEISRPSTGVTAAGPGDGAPSSADAAEGDIVLDNGLIRVVIDAAGLVASIRDLRSDREVLAPGESGNLLQLHPDFPYAFDAWDVDPWYRNTCRDLTEADEVALVRADAQEAAVRVVRSFGDSRIEQTLRLKAGVDALVIDTDVDWHEREKFLKAAFPLDVHAERASSEVPFGHVHRPTHANTSWDAARFEVPAHRWVHIGEPGFGVALTSTSVYGHDVSRTTREDGGTTTTLRLSLLRAPLYPDPEADQGRHRFSYVLHSGADLAQAVAEGYRTNLPVREVEGARAPQALISLEGRGSGSAADGGIVIEAVKAADDRSGDLVVRLYESLGTRASARLSTAFELAGAVETDLLERPLAEVGRAVGAVDEEGRVSIGLRPFQILTLRLSPKR